MSGFLPQVATYFTTGPVSQYRLVRLVGSDTVAVAQADTLGHAYVFGLTVTDTVTGGTAVSVQTVGHTMKMPVVGGLTLNAGDVLYLSDTTAGKATNVAPGYPVVVGVVLDADAYSPSNLFVEADLKISPILAITSGAPDTSHLLMYGLSNTLESGNGIVPGQGVVVSGRTAVSDGGEGSFYWTSDTTTPDDGGTVVVPTGPRIGCWKRVIDESLNVKWFGATGNGTTDDTTAIQATIDIATTTGQSVYLPDGYYRITNTINIGLRIFSEYDTFVNRIAPIDDPTFAALLIPANVTANLTRKLIRVLFETEAYLVADFTPLTYQPVLAYNLTGDNNPNGRMIGVKVIGASSFVGGKYVSTGTPVVSNIIGVFQYRGCTILERTFIAGVGCALLQAASYWTAVRDINIANCSDGLSISQGNAIDIDTALMFTCTRGLIWDGSASRVANLNTQQVTSDLVILGAECVTFGPGYFEDARNLPSNYFITCGRTADGADVTACTFTGIRLSGPPKKALNLLGTRGILFDSCRFYSATITKDTVSYGTIIACDFDITSYTFSQLGGPFVARLAPLQYEAASLALIGVLAYPFPYHDFGTITAQSYVTYDLTITAITTPFTYAPCSVTVLSAGNYMLKVDALLVNPTTIRVIVSNPLTVDQTMAFVGIAEVRLYG
jgi:hypothetical protein